MEPKQYTFCLIKGSVEPLKTEIGEVDPHSKVFAYKVIDFLLECVDFIEQAESEANRANHTVAITVGDGYEGTTTRWEGTILQASVLFEDHIMPMLRGQRPFAEPITALEE